MNEIRGPINPEIVKFWKDAGYELEPVYWIAHSRRDIYSTGPTYDVDVWDASKNGKVCHIIAYVYTSSNIPADYQFRDKLYTEKEMLQIIKLKMFI